MEYGRLLLRIELSKHLSCDYAVRHVDVETRKHNRQVTSPESRVNEYMSRDISYISIEQVNESFVHVTQQTSMCMHDPYLPYRYPLRIQLSIDIL
jgi:hypothetical protein